MMRARCAKQCALRLVLCMPTWAVERSPHRHVKNAAADGQQKRPHWITPVILAQLKQRHIPNLQ
jgi:hypothetical protein